jgi:hypothetical protein
MAVGTVLDGLFELGLEQNMAVEIEQAPSIIPLRPLADVLLKMPAEWRASVPIG